MNNNVGMAIAKKDRNNILSVNQAQFHITSIHNSTALSVALM